MHASAFKLPILERQLFWKASEVRLTEDLKRKPDHELPFLQCSSSPLLIFSQLSLSSALVRLSFSDGVRCIFYLRCVQQSVALPNALLLNVASISEMKRENMHCAVSTLLTPTIPSLCILDDDDTTCLARLLEGVLLVRRRVFGEGLEPGEEGSALHVGLEDGRNVDALNVQCEEERNRLRSKLMDRKVR